MAELLTIDDVLRLLQRGDMLLLPNHRAAREMRAVYDARQRSLGVAAWQPALAVAWSQWTNRLYNELIVNGAETRLLLNAAQEHSLWKDIIDEDLREGSLDSTDALAELAASAFRLAAAWNATGRIQSAASSSLAQEDNRIFARWATDFQQRCTAQKVLPNALLESTLAQHVERKTLRPPQALQLAGFSTLTPAQQSLLDAFAAQGPGIVQSQLVTSSEGQLRGKLLAESPAEEVQLAARWLRTMLERAQNRCESLRIAVLVPGLDEERAGLEAELRETLAPELQSVGEDLSSAPWEFSGGVPLSSLGMIADAMDILRWVAGPLPQARISALLVSPYLGNTAAREESAQLDALLRRKENLLRPEHTLGGFVGLLDKHRSGLAWPRHLATELSRSGDLTRPRSYADWMELLRTLLQATGWVNSDIRELTATEFEATRAWESVLDLVATLDYSGRRVSLARALEALELQVRTTPFSPPSNGAPVQIMTPAEAAGSLFDAVLFLRATDENWPAAERVNPLLPWQMQKELGMPGTDPVQAAEHARGFTQALVRSTGTVLFSSARSDANGQLRPSPLIAELGLEALDPATLKPSAAADGVVYETIRETSALPPLRNLNFHGGATLLKLQAACGFRAFAQLRLNASEPEPSELGFDARESGTIIHRVLHLFWRQVHDRETLESFSELERREALRVCIDQTLAAENRRLFNAWEGAYVQMLHERFLQVLMPWLERELERAPFEVIATERDETVAVGPLQLDVRMDRIDNVLDAEGKRLGEVYIDYKTGASAHPAQWLSERPDEPQLPLYTLLSNPEEVMGVAFAKLRAGEEMQYSGLQAQSYVLGTRNKKQTELVGQIAEWRQTLTQLAEDFAAGRAHVDPKQYPKTCAHCAHRLLCRLDPAALDRLEDDEAEDTDG